MFRVVLALLLLPLLALASAGGAQAHSRHHGGVEHCVVSDEELEIITIRRAPNNYSLIEKRLHPGECGVRVVDSCSKGWCPVVQGRFDGWVHSDNLAPVSRPVHCVASTGSNWTLDLHAEPSRRTRVVVSLGADYCAIAVTPNRVGHWVMVKAGPYYGWVGRSSIR
jgi:SH3-like domain-containing protein